jgi:hypothetical protein
VGGRKGGREEEKDRNELIKKTFFLYKHETENGGEFEK